MCCLGSSGAVLFFDGTSGQKVEVPGCGMATCAPAVDSLTGSIYAAGTPGLLHVVEDSVRLLDSPVRRPLLGGESLHVYVRGTLYDVSGRKVAVLQPGVMSTSALRAGVYIALRPGVAEPHKLVLIR